MVMMLVMVDNLDDNLGNDCDDDFSNMITDGY